MNDWWQAFLFFLPAGVANATPVLANRIPLLNRWRTAMDLGWSWRGRRLVGNNKTWRGFVAGTACAGLTAVLIYPLSNFSDRLLETLVIGLVLGAGALLGDAVESFAKRQLGITAGHSWFPFDQLDYIVGGLLLAWPLVHLDWTMVLMVLVLFFGLHLLVAYLAYLLGLKDKPI
jgi:CDP-2,3-bis-(O-geranylgeranyl)-sn-glycerol synthase